jgi:outer membrane protein OmpA-like peptidoglycan-associated protein
VKFYGDSNYPRNFERINAEIQKSFVALGLLSRTVPLAHAKWDYNLFKSGLTNVVGVEAPRFKEEEVTRFVSKMQQKGTLESAGRFAFEIRFQPEQNSFSVDAYQTEFDTVIDRASTYAGAIITVEGHSDPLGYLKAKKEGETEVVLSRIRQSAKNLSYMRANEVRESIIAYAKKKGIMFDTNQFAIIGHGITQPKGGMCGSDPCAPQTRGEWLGNMRVQFQIIPFESEAKEFEVL